MVSGAGTYDHGSVASLVATADEGYHFVGWTIDGAEVSGGSEIDVEMTGATTVTALFGLNQYDLIDPVPELEERSVGQALMIMEVWPVWWRLRMKDISFAGWTIDGAEVAGGTELSLEMTTFKLASASFVLNQYQLITISGIGGRIDGGVTYNHGIQ